MKLMKRQLQAAIMSYHVQTVDQSDPAMTSGQLSLQRSINFNTSAPEYGTTEHQSSNADGYHIGGAHGVSTLSNQPFECKCLLLAVCMAHSLLTTSRSLCTDVWAAKLSQSCHVRPDVWAAKLFQSCHVRPHPQSRVLLQSEPRWQWIPSAE